MRYYMYIDMDFIKNLVSVSGKIDFDIQVLEYSVQNALTCKNDVSVRPYQEKLNDYNKEWQDQKQKDKRQKGEHYDKSSLGVSYENSFIRNTSTERKYINIQDITDMKNINFYHNLVENIRTTYRDDTHIFNEYGFMKNIHTNVRGLEADSKYQILNINDSYLWYDKNMFCTNIDFLCNIACEVNAIGYTINYNKQENIRIGKALAVYID